MAQLLTVAREQFGLLGYRAVTMRAVAEQAGVSTRTLYDRYADKLSLFGACLDVGAGAFPRIEHDPGVDARVTLQTYTVALIETLSVDLSLRLGLLVYREGAEFPELVRAAEATQETHIVLPVAAYLARSGLAGADEHARAKLFIAMALSEWQRRLSFLRPMPEMWEIEEHAGRVVHLFLAGAREPGWQTR